jgi:ketosteroid isomerase-like protein
MSTEDGVRTASNQFYAALNRMAGGDASSMSEVWSHDAAATAMHPIGGRQSGWDAVKAAFDQVAALASAGHVALSDQLIQVCGDVAWESGVEQGELTIAGKKVPIGHRVTNVYRREAGGWRMIHHHTDVSPAMLSVLSQQ